MELFIVPDITPGSFIFDFEGQYHVLKHFSAIDEDYLKLFIDRGPYSKRDVMNRMQKFGSKFHLNFLTNPLELVQLLENQKNFVLNYPLKTKQRIEMQLVFDMARYPEGIGNDTLVRKKDFSVDAELKVRMRKGFPVHYKKGEPLPTWECQVIFTRTDGVWRLTTYFPGKYAPPFPDRSIQSKEDFEKCADFWNKHIFLTK